jgi:hypothetical protein
MILARELLPYIETLAASFPVIAIKGLAICARYGAWSRRGMGDFDIHVRFQDLEAICRRLRADGWAPGRGMTWDSLVHRIACKRASWGLTRGPAELDLHWRIADDAGQRRLEQALWAEARTFEVQGCKILVPSPEIALIYALDHGFRQGTRADAMQTILDAVLLLGDCDMERLARAIADAGLVPEFRRLRSLLIESGVARAQALDEGAAGSAAASPPRRGPARPGFLQRIRDRRASRVPPSRMERKLLKFPRLYRAWEAVGRPRPLEMLLLRAVGPFTMPLRPQGVPKALYDLRRCEVVDEIGGVGWGWPEPEPTCIWSDRADARLIVPVLRRTDYRIALSFSVYRGSSPAPDIAVLANGHLVGSIDFRRTPEVSTYVFPVTKRMLFSDWLEISLRPNEYVPERLARENYALRRGVPIQRLQLVRMDDPLATPIDLFVASPLQEKVEKGIEPYKSRFERIRATIAASPSRNSNLLPPDFDPVLYVLNNPGLFDAEVDPYFHYLTHGRSEGRLWR